MRRVIHLLPYDGIGGAEAAARSMADAPTPGLDFRLQYLFPRADAGRQRRATFNPFAFVRALRRILASGPDLLIVSLWRSCIVGILVKLLRRRIRLVVLIHNSVDAHLADRLFTRWAMALADAVWVDSDASMRMRFARKPRAPVVVIPFLTRRLAPLQPIDEPCVPTPSFVFWGRLAAQKNLARALALFHRIRQVRTDAHFTVIGPDSGELAGLQSLCVELGIEDAVRFTGPLAFEGIRALASGHAFYLQVSRYEGMAMSVVEAMQSGLVPVTTPVGEIGSYCRHGHNAICVDGDARAADDVLRLLEDTAGYRSMRANAIRSWHGKPLYRDAVLAECLRLTAAAAATKGTS